MIIDFAIFPMDKGVSLSRYVARAIKIINDSGLPHTLHPMAYISARVMTVGVLLECLMVKNGRLYVKPSGNLHWRTTPNFPL